jgi:cytochrome c oxidase assembly protein subunit 15
VAVTSDPLADAPPVDAGPAAVSRWLRPALVANLVAQIGIVVTGGLVRLTGSGLGCPTWPRCTAGSYTPEFTPALGIHDEIEFGNRLLTFAVSACSIAALVAVVRYVRAGHAAAARRRLLVLGALPLVGVAIQALVGGLTVHTALNPNVVAPHFLVSMLLIAASTVLLLEVGETVAPPEPSPPVGGPLRVLVLLLCGVAAVVLVLGTVVTGSGPHSGDAEKPARLGLDPRTMSWLHADAVWLFVGLVVGLLLTLALTGDQPRALRRARWLLGVTLLQGAIGYTQYTLDLPIGLVSLHMLGASLLVLAVTATAHPLLRRRPDAPAEGRAALTA